MTKWLWLFRPPNSGDVPTLTSGKVALFHSRVVCQESLCTASSGVHVFPASNMWLILKTIWKLQIVQNAATISTDGPATVYPCNTSTLQAGLVVYLLLVQFKMLAITYKDLHGIRPNYLRDWLSHSI